MAAIAARVQPVRRDVTLLKERLTDEGIEYCYLDGSTTDRARVVEQFLPTQRGRGISHIAG